MNKKKHLPFYEQPLFLLQLAGWAIYTLGDYADHVLNYDIYYAVPSFGSGLAAYLLTGLCAALASKIQGWRMSIKAPVFLLALYLSSIVWHKIWSSMHEDSEDKIIAALQKIPDLTLEQWIGTGYVPLLLFLSWAGFYVGGKMYFTRLEQQEVLHEAVLATKKAQLHTLRYQLNPHFLFNSLNSVDVSVQSGDNETAHQMIKYLTRFLRRSLELGEQDKIPFGQEIALIKDFIAIEELRFKDTLSIDLNVSLECMEAMVPPMFMQPLIENALKFAWNQRGQGKVGLSAERHHGTLCIDIVNSMSEQGGADMAGTGTGLKNTRDRLTLLYGEDAQVNVFDLKDRFKVELRLPWEAPVT